MEEQQITMEFGGWYFVSQRTLFYKMSGWGKIIMFPGQINVENTSGSVSLLEHYLAYQHVERTGQT